MIALTLRELLVGACVLCRPAGAAALSRDGSLFREPSVATVTRARGATRCGQKHDKATLSQISGP
jgi:hypothetical protein